MNLAVVFEALVLKYLHVMYMKSMMVEVYLHLFEFEGGGLVLQSPDYIRNLLGIVFILQTWTPTPFDAGGRRGSTDMRTAEKGV